MVTSFSGGFFRKNRHNSNSINKYDYPADINTDKGWWRTEALEIVFQGGKERSHGYNL